MEKYDKHKRVPFFKQSLLKYQMCSNYGAFYVVFLIINVLNASPG